MFVKIFPTFKEANVAYQFCPIYNPFFFSLKQEVHSEYLVYHGVERQEPVWGFRSSRFSDPTYHANLGKLLALLGYQ